MINFIPVPIFTAIDENGDPRVGAKLYTYVSGSSLIPQVTYTDHTLGTQNTNPVILNSNGQASIWIDSASGAYRFRLYDADDVLIWDQDEITTPDSELYDLLLASGDMIYASTPHNGARLGAGNAHEMLKMNSDGTVPQWADSPQSLFAAAGDLLYAPTANELAKLAAGTALQGLTMNAGANAPQWVDSPNSILADKGGILYASAANVLAQLAIGTAGQKLFVNPSSDGIEWGSGLFIGKTTRDMDLISGTQEITGVGFKPTVVLFLAVADSDGNQGLSIGMANASVNYSAHNSAGDADNGLWGIGTYHSIHMHVSSTWYYQGQVSVFGADGFTITWTKGGTPFGIMTVFYLAIR